MRPHPLPYRGFVEDLDQLRTDRPTEADVGDDPLAEERIGPVGPVEELVGEHDVARPDPFAERADGVDRDDPFDA